MDNKELVNYCIDSIKKLGADKASCSLEITEKKELNVESGEITLMRTTFNTDINITIIKNRKKGSTIINKRDKESINFAIEEAIHMAEASQIDEAYDISEYQPRNIFNKGPKSANNETMYTRLKEFVDYVNKAYPKINLEQTIVDYKNIKSFYQNTNGVDFQINKGYYSAAFMFLAKEKEFTSSFNYTRFSSLNLTEPFYKYGSINTLLRQCSEQLKPKKIEEKFDGQIIITPDCLHEFLHFIIADISGPKMISKNSIYKNMINKSIANPKLTLKSKPLSKNFADGYFITNDGYEAKNCTIIKNGVLQTYLLDKYASNKLDLDRTNNSGGNYIVEPGIKSHKELIKEIKKGVLLARFSGGNPANNGDFSGVAKNSYYIENGEIQYPITETMVSGNLKEMFENLYEISSDQINNGSNLLPWIAFDGLTIS